MARAGLMAALASLPIAGAAVVASGRRRQRAQPLTEPQKVPFLGGSDPHAHAWQRFHARYYTMLLVFIAFEMEMMFMYPWAVVFVREGAKALMEMGMFLGILSVGILYGWREGAFRWR